MPVTDYSTTPASNTAINGINIAEGCPAGNMNAAVRQMMADIRVFYNGVPVGSDYMLKTGGAFLGDITRNGRGGYAHHASATYLSFQVHTTAYGASQPSGMQVGDWWVELEP